MHKNILTSIGLFACLGLSAQGTYNAGDDVVQSTNSLDMTKISVGIKLSPAISWVDAVNTDLQSDGATLKLGVGAVLDYQLLPAISMVSGVNFNSYGGYVFDNKSLNNIVFRNNYLVNYSEIEVPFSFKISTLSESKTTYFLQAGFSAGFVLNATEKRVPLANNAKNDYTDILVLTNPTRVNCLAGVGVNYKIGTKTSLFGLIMYKKSLTSLANSQLYEANRYTNPVQLYPGNMEFSMGIMF